MNANANPSASTVVRVTATNAANEFVSLTFNVKIVGSD